jgi:geranylgeranylglycerol-phosphate geranylgeranyltransferase
LNFINYLKLYRFDVFVITAITTVCGEYLTNGVVNVNTLYNVLFISGILYNYVYVLNALTDIEADRINKPERPLPSGKISFRSALIYLSLIAVLAISGAVFLYDGFHRNMVIMVLIIGGIYSAPPIALKNIPIIAQFITGWGIVHPIFITGDFNTVIFPAVVLTLYAMGTTLLKDLSDIEGDKKEGRKVVTNFISIKNLMVISMFMTFTASIFCIKLKYPIIGFAPFATFITTLYFYKYKSDDEIKEFIYKKMLLSVAVVGSIVMLLIITGIG